ADCEVRRPGIEEPLEEERLWPRHRSSHLGDPLPHDRCHVHRGLLAVERTENVTEPAHRAALDTERAVSAGAAHAYAQPAHLLLGDLDRIEPAPCDPLGRAAELTECVPRAAEDLGMLLGEKA